MNTLHWHPTPNGLALHNDTNPTGYLLRACERGVDILHRHITGNHVAGCVSDPAAVVRAFMVWHPTWTVPEPDMTTIRECSTRPLVDVFAEWNREDRRSVIVSQIAALERELAGIDGVVAPEIGGDDV